MSKLDDVEAYILYLHGGSITHLKMQKLFYYCQAFSLTWTKTALFPDDIFASSSGPRIRHYTDRNSSKSFIEHSIGDLGNLSMLEQVNIRHIVTNYMNYSGSDLVAWSKKEDPWLESQGHNISHESMIRYYSKTGKEREADKLRLKKYEEAMKASAAYITSNIVNREWWDWD